MTMLEIPEDLRTKDQFHHIDMGFLNYRLCITALLPEAREHFLKRQLPGTDHQTVYANRHRLVGHPLGLLRSRRSTHFA